MKEIKVMTDCGEITAVEYDDGIAKGIEIRFNEEVVALVDCHCKETKELPTRLELDLNEFDSDNSVQEQIADVISDHMDWCVQSLKCEIDNERHLVIATDIVWEEDIPEARLLVYEMGEDEPNQVIPLN